MSSYRIQVTTLPSSHDIPSWVSRFVTRRAGLVLKRSTARNHADSKAEWIPYAGIIVLMLFKWAIELYIYSKRLAELVIQEIRDQAKVIDTSEILRRKLCR